MTLRVFLEDNEGNKSYIDYGLAAENYKMVYKVEIREDSSKTKHWMGSKWTGIPEIDKEIQEQDEKGDSNTPYEIFNYDKHSDKKWYWISVACTNCNETSQIAIPLGTKINPKQLKPLKCRKCKVKGSLKQARWDGHKYIIVGGGNK